MDRFTRVPSKSNSGKTKNVRSYRHCLLGANDTPPSNYYEFETNALPLNFITILSYFDNAVPPSPTRNDIGRFVTFVYTSRTAFSRRAIPCTVHGPFTDRQNPRISATFIRSTRSTFIDVPAVYTLIAQYRRAPHYSNGLSSRLLFR